MRIKYFKKPKALFLQVFVVFFSFFIIFSLSSYLKYGFVDYNVFDHNDQSYLVSFDEILKLKEDKLVDLYHFKVDQNDQILDFEFENKEFKYLTIYVNSLNVKSAYFKIEYLGDKQVVAQEVLNLKMGTNVYKLPYNLAYNGISITSTNELTYVVGLNGISMNTEFNAHKSIFKFSLIVLGLIILIQIKKIKDVLYYFAQPIEEYYNKVKSFVQSNIVGVIGIIFLNVLTFGFLVTNFTLSLDEELKLMNPQDMGWVGYGRFGIYFLNKLLLVDEKFTPYFTDFFAALFLGVATLLFLLYFEERSSEKKNRPVLMFVFSGIFMSVPLVVGEYMSFGVYNMELGLGYILVASSLYFSNKFLISKSYNNLLWSFLTLSVSISIYQSFISVYVSGTVLGILIYLMNQNEVKKYYTISIEIIVNFGILCASVLAYFILNKYFQSTITAAYGYIANFIGWGSDLGFRNVLKIIVKQIREILLGKYDKSGIVILVSTISFGAYSIAKGVHLENNLKKIVFLLFSLCFILSPFLIMLALGTALPGRALQALPLFLGGSWYLILKYPINHFTKRVAITISIFLIFIQLQFINIMFYGDYLRYQEDSYLGRQIMTSIEKCEINYKKKPLVFIGSRKLDSSYLISKINSGGKSFFEDESQMYRMTYFINSLGYNVITPTYEEMDKGREYNDEMAAWPQDGSIKELEDLIVIKLSDID